MRRLIVALTIASTVLAGTSFASSHVGTRTTATPAWVATAKQRLSSLDTKPAGSMDGYQPRQTSFGPDWYDVDVNGCDTRNDILARDLKQIVLKSGSGCKVAKGTLHDPYTSKTISFVQGPMSAKVQIDHVVALAAAWRTGAKQWRPKDRLFYANDPLVLLAVDGPANGQKSDGDAAEWLPTNIPFRCRYLARQIAIKTKYDLWVTQPERMAMSATLANC